MNITFPKVYNTYFLAIISTIGGMLFGFDISSISAIIITDQYVTYFDNPHGLWQGGIGAALVCLLKEFTRQNALIYARPIRPVVLSSARVWQVSFQTVLDEETRSRSVCTKK